MPRRTWLALLLLTACGASGGEGGGSSWQPGLVHVPAEGGGGSGASTSYTTGYQPPSGPGCPGRREVDNSCSCQDEFDSRGECVCQDGCWCSGCPTGVCGTNVSADYGGSADECLQTNCCDEVRTCALGDDFACDDCLYAGGGALCDELISCATQFECSLPQPLYGDVCGTGLTFDGDGPVDACVGGCCCAEFTACTGVDGANVEACGACLDEGGGDLCDPLLACMAARDCRGDSPETCEGEGGAAGAGGASGVGGNGPGGAGSGGA